MRRSQSRKSAQSRCTHFPSGGRRRAQERDMKHSKCVGLGRRCWVIPHCHTTPQVHVSDMRLNAASLGRAYVISLGNPYPGAAFLCLSGKLALYKYCLKSDRDESIRETRNHMVRGRWPDKVPAGRSWEPPTPGLTSLRLSEGLEQLRER